jgi:hypothetical protein
MLQFYILLFVVLLMAGAVAFWLADTALEKGLVYVYSAVTSIVLVSVLYDMSLILSLPYWAFLLIAILIAGFLLYYSLRKNPLTRARLNIFGLKPGLYSVVIIGLIYYLSSLFIPLSVRWGKTDARAIWSLHALFFTDPHHWSDMFTNTISWSHPDYPLMLPSWIAMLWRAMGMTDAVVPCVIAYLTLVVVLITVSMALKEENKYLLGICGLLAFVFTRSYAEMPAFQGADTLVSLFMLMAFVLARRSGRDMKLIFLTGFIAGFAGWVKNEGIAFILVFSLAMIWEYRKARGLLLYYIFGLALPVFIIAIYKTGYAPANDIIAGQNLSIISRLTDVSRYQLTWSFFWRDASSLYPVLLVILTLVAVRGYRRLLDVQLLALFMMVAVYFFIFIITPRDLEWHLATASVRLFLQLFPAAVYVLMYLLGRDSLAKDQSEI